MSESGPSVVMNIRYVTMNEIEAVSRHQHDRRSDKTSAIWPERSHLNRVLAGDGTQKTSLNKIIEEGVKPPSKRAREPYIQMVLGASPEYFRDPDQGPGEWNSERLEKWVDATMSWLRSEYGQDLTHADLHLDETTPHMHVLITPTYERKRRRPGKMKKGETAEEFEARKLAAENEPTIRTISRSTNEFWRQPWARRTSRQNYHSAIEHLGIGYGRDFIAEGAPSPEYKTTGRHLLEQSQTNEIQEQRHEKFRKQGREWVEEMQAQQDKMNARQLKLDEREADLARREAKLEQANQALEELKATNEEISSRLMERQLKLAETRTKLQKLLALVNSLTGEVADQLGVGRQLSEIAQAIRSYGVKEDGLAPD